MLKVPLLLLLGRKVVDLLHLDELAKGTGMMKPGITRILEGLPRRFTKGTGF
jgi:hypothetical protein